VNNYYRVFLLPRDIDAATLEEQLNHLGRVQPQLVADVSDILGNDHCRREYDRMHAQYEALSVVFDVFSAEEMLDTNNWSGRLAEFS